jgi:hypothetical protein
MDRDDDDDDDDELESESYSSSEFYDCNFLSLIIWLQKIHIRNLNSNKQII